METPHPIWLPSQRTMTIPTYYWVLYWVFLTRPVFHRHFPRSQAWRSSSARHPPSNATPGFQWRIFSGFFGSHQKTMIRGVTNFFAISTSVVNDNSNDGHVVCWWRRLHEGTFQVKLGQMDERFGYESVVARIWTEFPTQFFFHLPRLNPRQMDGHSRDTWHVLHLFSPWICHPRPRWQTYKFSSRHWDKVKLMWKQDTLTPDNRKTRDD